MVGNGRLAELQHALDINLCYLLIGAGDCHARVSCSRFQGYAANGKVSPLELEFGHILCRGERFAYGSGYLVKVDHIAVAQSARIFCNNSEHFGVAMPDEVFTNKNPHRVRPHVYPRHDIASHAKKSCTA